MPAPEQIIPPTPPPAAPKKKDKIPPPLNLAPEVPSDNESVASSPSQSPRSKSPRTVMGFQLQGQPEGEDEERDFGEPLVYKFKEEGYEPVPLESVESPPARKSSVPVIMVDDTEASKKPKKKRSVKKGKDEEEPKEEAPKPKPKMRSIKRAGSPEKAAEPPPSPRGRRSSVCVAAEPGHIPAELVNLPQTATVTVQGVVMTVEDAEKMLEPSPVANGVPAKPAEAPKPKKKESVPEIAVQEPEEAPPKRVVPIVKEPTPEPNRKESLAVGPGGTLEPVSPGGSPAGSRRGSVIITADEKGMVVDEAGKMKKLRPGEMVEVRQRRRSSIDMRRASVSELQEKVEKPSTPLRPIPESEEGPPNIVDYQENVTAVEGGTAYLSVQVEGNPVPQFRFYKGVSEVYEGGRYKVITDGETNTVCFCIRKAKSTDEGKYKVVAYNKHGEDSVTMNLFVSDESGMDFRAMLKHRQYAKWGMGKDDPDWQLKQREEEKEQIGLRKPKPDAFLQPLENVHVKEGRDKLARFQAVFSKSGVKGKWFRNRQEIFMGKKYHMTSQGDLHVLEVMNPTVEDGGRYTLTCLDTSCQALLEVDDPDPVYKFVKKLPSKSQQYTTKELVLECTTNSHKAPVQWLKDDKKIAASDKYIIEQDQFGKKILRVQNCTLEDTGLYTCKINSEEKTSSKVTITEQKFQFMKGLKSFKIFEDESVTLECEVDEWEAPVQWFKDGKGDQGGQAL
ncbi:hypothetical protein MRX96_017671 [Rhipicephalus microplus]